jgi:hypothetical protein
VRVRRSLLATFLALGLVSAACLDTVDVSAPEGMTDRPGAEPGTATATETGLPVDLPELEPWQAGPGEVMPQVKELATSAVETAGTWDGGRNGGDALGSRLAAIGLSPALAEAAAPLVDGRASAATVEVVYPQYGGIRDDRASVMVVAEQYLAIDADIEARGVTVDVRLADGPGGWQVEALLPAPPPASAADPPELARSVLENPRIRIPDAARADIAAGIVDPLMLGLMEQLAQDHVLDVAVLVSGHPRNVFGLSKLSNHAKGRAVDLWAIDDQPVVHPDTPRALVEEVVRTAQAYGADEIGSPYDFDGPQRRIYFTDDVHEDHLHLGFEPSESAPPEAPLP